MRSLLYNTKKHVPRYIVFQVGLYPCLIMLAQFFLHRLQHRQHRHTAAAATTHGHSYLFLQEKFHQFRQLLVVESVRRNRTKINSKDDADSDNVMKIVPFKIHFDCSKCMLIVKCFFLKKPSFTVKMINNILVYFLQ